MDKKRISHLLSSFVVIPTLLFSNPSGEQTVQGDCSFDRTADTLSIHQQTDKAIVNWQDFSIGQGETTRILQPNEASTILNRVISNQPSSIYGNLHSNGQVFLINQSGILIGPSGVIRTNGFVASALDVANAEFLGGKEMTLSGDSNAIIINQGMIDGLRGNVFLLAREVVNEGIIEAKEGTVGLAAGSEVLLAEEGSQKFIIRVREQGTLSNTGLIESVQIELISAGGNSGALAINQEGTIHSSGIVERNGRIFLEAEEGLVSVKGNLKAEGGGTIHVLGEFVFLEEKAILNASGEFGGGEILIGGGFQGKDPTIRNADLTSIAPDVTILADAILSGDGGRAIFWGNRACHFFGTASARGGAESGDGGLIETSSHLDLRYEGLSDLNAPFGKAGTLLLDPTDITISSGANSGTPLFTTTTTTYTSSTTPSVINATTLQTALENGSVSISTTSGAGGTGDITIDATTGTISWTANNDLTLTADGFVSFVSGAVLDSQGSGAITITGNGANATQDGIRMAGAITVNGGNLTMTGTSGTGEGFLDGIVWTTGTVTSTGIGNIGISGTGRGTSFSRGLNIGSAGWSIATTGTSTGTITLTGTGATAGTSNSGIRFIDSSGSVASVDGTITITGTARGGNDGQGVFFLAEDHVFVSCAGTGDININGTSTAMGTIEHGVLLSARIEHTGTGNIAITGTASASSTGTFNVGVYFDNQRWTDGITHSGSSGNITITGTGGTGSDSNNGVRLLDRSITITTGTHNVTLTGTARSSTTGSFNNGVRIDNSNGGITHSGTGGTIGLSGTGGGGRTGGFNNGIFLLNELTISGSNGVDVTFDGTGGTGSAGSNNGIELTSTGSRVSSVNGNITLTGTGGGGTSSRGVNNNNATVTCTGSGDIALTGTASAGTNNGIVLTGTVATITSTSTGNITLTGTGSGEWAGSEDISISATTATVLGGATSGDITLFANSLDYPVASGNIVAANATIIFSPKTAPITIGVGNLAKGTLQIDATNIGTVGEAKIGRVDGTGAVDITTANFSTAPVLIMGGDIAVSGTLTGNGGAALHTSLTTANAINVTGSVTTTSNGDVRIGPISQTSTFGVGTSATNTIISDTSIANLAPVGTGVVHFGQRYNDMSISPDNIINVNTSHTFTASVLFVCRSLVLEGNLSAGANNVTFNIAQANDGTFSPRTFTITGGTITASAAGLGVQPDNLNGTFDLTNGIIQNITITGSGSGTSNELQASTTGTNTWTFTSTSAGTLVNGNTATFRAIDIATGGGSSNTMTGPNLANTWTITANDAGNIVTTPPTTTLTFTNTQNLQGGTNTDTFILNNGFGTSGTINGGTGTNELDYSNYTSNVEVHLQDLSATNINGKASSGFSNIQTFTGPAAGTNTLTGPNSARIWTITGENDGTIDTAPLTTFNDFNILQGGTDTNTFDFTAAVRITNHINGGITGFNTIIGHDVNNAWNITTANQGTLTASGAGGDTVFMNIQNLTGGSMTDGFTFSNGAIVAGAINGTSTSGNSFNYSAYTTVVNINIETGVATGIGTIFRNIQTFTGGSAENTLTGPNSNKVWNITANNAGTIDTTGITTFSAFSNLVGGTMNDTFTFNGSFQVNGSTGLVGGSGTNTIVGPADLNNWAITTSNAGTITPTGATGATIFSSIQNLTGGSMNDTFVFSDGISIDGTLDGSTGTTNTLDLSDYTSAVTVNLAANTATGTGAITNLNTFIGPNGQSNNFLGPNASTWNITANDTGTVDGNSFTDFPNLTGGTMNDTFIFADGFGVAGSIDGGTSGTNTLDYSNYTTATNINIQTSVAPNLPSFTNIQSLIGSSTATSTLTGRNSADIWNLTGTNSGDITGVVTSFSNFQNLTGGTANDTFVIEGGTLAGTITGGTGTNSIQGGTTAQTFTLNGAGAGSTTLVDAFTGINSITGGSSNESFTIVTGATLAGTLSGGGGTNTLTGPDETNTWNVNTSNAGNLVFASTITFTNMQNLAGGNTNDTFVFANQITVPSSIEGGNVTNNTLDYSAFVPDAIISYDAALNSGNVQDSGQSILYTFNNIQTITGNVTFVGQPPASPPPTPSGPTPAAITQTVQTVGSQSSLATTAGEVNPSNDGPAAQFANILLNPVTGFMLGGGISGSIFNSVMGFESGDTTRVEGGEPEVEEDANL